jgi:hypothetical protein
MVPKNQSKNFVLAEGFENKMIAKTWAKIFVLTLPSNGAA